MALSDRRFARRVGIVLAMSLVALAALGVLVAAFQFILVVFAGILLAVLLDGLTGRVVRHTGLPRPVALPLVIVGILAVMGGFWWGMGAMLNDQIGQIQELIPELTETIDGWLDQVPWLRAMVDEAPPVHEFLLGGGVVGHVTGVFTTVFGLVVNVIIILFVGLYGAARPHLYIDNALFLVPRNHRERAREVIGNVARALRYWFFGQFIAMVAVGSITAIGLTLLGVPFALALGLLAFLLEFVPYLGPVIAFVPIVLVALMESPQLALFTAIFFLAVQQVESYVVTPMAQQYAVSMPPALLIVGQMLFGLMGGLWGIVLATPVLVAVVVLVQTLYVEDVVGEDVVPLGSDHGAEDGGT